MKKRNLRLNIPVMILLVCSVCWAAVGGNRNTDVRRIIIIQGAGHKPAEKASEETDAITHATTKEINTYTLTEMLVKKLDSLKIQSDVTDYRECKNLRCLHKTPAENRGKFDMVIFAGPSHFSKQPPQLTKLYNNHLGEAVKQNPGLLCSTLVPAWFPETKGADTIKVANKAFEKHGAGVVQGISILTPRDKKKGASQEEIAKALDEFAQRIVEALAD
jgi:hypothetical protein